MDVDGRGVKRGVESSQSMVESPPGLQAGSENLLMEILASVKSTEGRLGRLQTDVSEAKRNGSKKPNSVNRDQA